MAAKDHSHHHHPHEHHDGHGHDHAHPHHEIPTPAQQRKAPSRFRSLIALSGLQRLLLALPIIAMLWLMTFWAMGRLS